MRIDKQKAARIMVFLVIAGLLGSYLPILFAPQPAYQPATVPQDSNNQSASLIDSVEENTITPEPKEKLQDTTPSAFGGIEEETGSLEDIEKMLE